MNGPHITQHGDVVSSALDTGGTVHAEKTLFSEMSLLKGQIQQIYAVDDPQNQITGAGNQTFYDVLVHLPNGATEVIRRCRMLQPMFGGGFNNFMECLPTDPGPKAKDGLASTVLRRGSQVLVGFMSGQKTAGVILGAMPHTSEVAADKRPTKDEGTTLKGEFQGFQWQIFNDGSITLVFNGPRDDSGNIIGSDGPTTLLIDAKGNYRFTTNNQQTVEVDRVKAEVNIINGTTSYKMEQNGSKITMESDFFTANVRKDANINTGGKTIVHATGEAIIDSKTKIKLQKADQTPDEPFVLGATFVKFMSQFLQAVLTHTHIGNLGFETTPPENFAVFAQLKASPVDDKKIISDHIIGLKG